MWNFWNFQPPSEASAMVALGLHSLQHRGQEGCGIVSYDGKTIIRKKNKD